MASIFEELVRLSRPFVAVTLTLGGKEIPCQARSLSAAEEDIADSHFKNVYSRILNEKRTPQGESPLSETEIIRSIYSTRPKEDLVDQLMITRQDAIQQEAIRSLGLDMRVEYLKLQAMDADEKVAYEKSQSVALEAALAEARKIVRADMMGLPMEQLVNQVTDVNINVKALEEANKEAESQFLLYALHTLDTPPAPVFASLDDVRSLPHDQIHTMAVQSREALHAEAKSNLPFASGTAAEPVKPTSSPSNSEAATETSGTPTETTPAD